MEFDSLMAPEVVDTDVLKRNVVHLLLKHPQGIKLGDFSGAFYKFHGRHPQLALHGYSSLKNLLTDMKKVVVVEESSQDTVIKLVDGDPFYQWLAEDEGWDSFEEEIFSSEDGLDSFEEELQSLRHKEAEAERCRPATSLDFSVFNSVAQNVGGKKSVLAAALVPILSILRSHPSGLDLQTLTESLKKRGFDLERFSRDMGYSDTISCLLEMPGPHLIFQNGMKPHNCVVQLFTNSPGLPAPPLCTGSSEPKPSSSGAAGTSSQCLTETKPGKKKKKKKKKSHNTQAKMTKRLGEVLALVTNSLNTHKSGLRVKKLEELLLTKWEFDLEKFSVAQGYKDTLEFLEQKMPELVIKYRENRCKCVVKQGPVNVAPFLFKAQPQVGSAKMVGPPYASPDFGGLPKPFCEGGVTKGGAGASALWTSLPSPSTVVPNHPSSKEQCGASSGKEKSSPQPPSAIPAQLPSARQLGGQTTAGEFPRPTDAQVLSKSSPAKPSLLGQPDELKQQVAHILSRHPKGMSLFQFRAAYSATYQRHLPLGNASSAKQRLLEMSDVVLLKGYGVQTLLLPVSPREPPVKPSPPVLSELEDAAVVLDDLLAKAVVRPEPPVVFCPPSLLKIPVEPQPCTTHPLASEHLGATDVEESCVLPKRTTQEAVAPSQEPVRPKISFGAPLVSSKAEKAVKNLGDSSTKAAGKMEPALVPESSRQPSLPQTAAMPGLPLHFSVPSTPTDSRAPDNRASFFFPECLLPKPPKPAVPSRGNARARVMPRENLFTPHSPVVFLAEPQVSTLNGIWTSESFASRPTYLANPPFSVNVPVPSLFQPVLTNIVGVSQPVVYPPLPPLPDTPANPSLSSPSHQPVYRTLPRTQLQKIEPASSHLAPSVPRNRPVMPTSPIRHVEPTGCTRPTGGLDRIQIEFDGLDPLQNASRTQDQGHSPTPWFSFEGPPVSSPPAKPPGLQPLKPPSLQQPENVHPTWLSRMQCSSVPAIDENVAASPSARVPSEPVVPARQKLYDVMDTPISSPTMSSFTASQQPDSSSFGSCTESDALPSKPLVSVSQPHIVLRNPAVTSSNAQPSTLLFSSQGSSISPASQSSCVSLRPNMGYNASRQSQPLPRISVEGGGQDSGHFTSPDNQRFPLQEEATQQNSPPRRSSDNCAIL